MTAKNSRFGFFLRKTRISCFSACNYFVTSVNFTELRHINLCSLRNATFRFTAQRATVIFLRTAFFCFVFPIFALLRIIFISHAKIAPLLQNLRARYVLTQFFVRKNAASVQIRTQCGISCAVLTRLWGAVPEMRGTRGTSIGGKGFGTARRPPCRWRPARPQTQTRR